MCSLDTCAGLLRAWQRALTVHGSSLQLLSCSPSCCRSLSEFNIAVVGDLHLDPEAMGLFHEARNQIMQSMLAPGGSGRAQAGARVVQLGDLGSYHCGPGGWGCFTLAREYLAGFRVPAATILGNHDLEGAEFESDEENLEAWKQVGGCNCCCPPLGGCSVLC